MSSLHSASPRHRLPFSFHHPFSHRSQFSSLRQGRPLSPCASFSVRQQSMPHAPLPPSSRRHHRRPSAAPETASSPPPSLFLVSLPPVFSSRGLRPESPHHPHSTFETDSTASPALQRQLPSPLPSRQSIGRHSLRCISKEWGAAVTFVLLQNIVQ